jgi:protein-S-isoprenylcysteine O-methyltransferase
LYSSVVARRKNSFRKSDAVYEQKMSAQAVEEEEDQVIDSEEEIAKSKRRYSEQVHGTVTIQYEGPHVVLPLGDYAKLLYDMSNPNSIPQFYSRVGLARVALLGGALGVILGAHLVLLMLTFEFPSIQTSWCMYSLAMCIYHWSEFLLTALHHPQSVSFDSFLVNQSKEYGIAIAASWIEFAIEAFLFPWMKQVTFIIVMGMGLVMVGQTLRSASMYQAGPSFTHQVASEKAPRHVLISTGVYTYLRHPGYFGWFYWSIGTQFILCNPICFLAYFKVAQQFFRNRIPIEEQALVDIFGDEYRRYKQRTYIGIPGVAT